MENKRSDGTGPEHPEHPEHPDYAKHWMACFRQVALPCTATATGGTQQLLGNRGLDVADKYLTWNLWRLLSLYQSINLPAVYIIRTQLVIPL